MAWQSPSVSRLRINSERVNLLFLFLLATLRCMLDLSSLTRDGSRAKHRVLTTGPPGKSCKSCFKWAFEVCSSYENHTQRAVTEISTSPPPLQNLPHLLFEKESMFPACFSLLVFLCEIAKPCDPGASRLLLAWLPQLIHTAPSS